MIWDEQTWREMYRATDGIESCTYGPEFFRIVESPFARRASWLVDHYQLTDEDRVLVVGAAFGYLPAALINLSVPTIGIDSSPWIAAQRADHAALVLYVDLEHTVPSDLPWEPTLLVTESMMESVSDLDAAVAATHALSARIVHLITTPLSHPSLRSMTIDEWQQVDPAADWIDVGVIDRG